MLAERPATSKDCARTAPSAKLVALGFDEPCELAALVTGIRDDRFDRRKDWAQAAEQTCGCAPI